MRREGREHRCTAIRLSCCVYRDRFNVGIGRPIGAQYTICRPGAGELGLVVFSESGSQPIDCVLQHRSGEKDGGMWYAPHRFQGGRIIQQPWNHMPVDVRELISQEFIVNLLRMVDLR